MVTWHFYLYFRWQDRCLQIRLAAQELLVAELKNLGPKGRKHLVEMWGAYLPKFGDPPFQNNSSLNNGHNNHSSQNSQQSHETSNNANDEDLDDDLDEDIDDDEDIMKLRRNQSTAVILLGVIGALFDLEAEKDGQTELALGTNMTRLTAKALMYLVLTSTKVSVFGENSLKKLLVHFKEKGKSFGKKPQKYSKILGNYQVKSIFESNEY